jgi:hypothetical protein
MLLKIAPDIHQLSQLQWYILIMELRHEIEAK